jgi:hypothetical protein
VTGALLFFYLVVAHALCDYPLQGDFLSRGKNHTNPIAGVPWYQCLFAHSLIHAGAVAALTGSVLLGSLEFCLHAAIDYFKCAGHYSFNCDQLLHVCLKVTWACWGTLAKAHGVTLP